MAAQELSDGPQDLLTIRQRPQASQGEVAYGGDRGGQPNQELAEGTAVRLLLHLRPVLRKGPLVTLQDADDALVPHPAAALLLLTLCLPHSLGLRLDAFGAPAVPGEGVGPKVPGRLPNGCPGGTALQFLSGQPLQKCVGPGDLLEAERALTARHVWVTGAREPPERRPHVRGRRPGGEPQHPQAVRYLCRKIYVHVNLCSSKRRQNQDTALSRSFTSPSSKPAVPASKGMPSARRTRVCSRS